MSKQSEKVKRWRKRTKERIILAMGGKCCFCGYNKCSSALSLHHLDPSKKEFGLGAVRGSPKSWNKIVIELRKCILVCNNCHAEIHEGVLLVPLNVSIFNESFIEYNILR